MLGQISESGFEFGGIGFQITIPVMKENIFLLKKYFEDIMRIKLADFFKIIKIQFEKKYFF